MKSSICAVVLAALVNPTLADEYWVQYNYSTQSCSVVETKSQEPAAGTARGITAAQATNIIAPNDDTATDATHGANIANAATEGAVSDPPGVATSSATPMNTSPENNNFDPTAALIAWAGKKDAVEAAMSDAAKTVLGTAIQSREQDETKWRMIVISAIWAIWARKQATSVAARSDAAKAFLGIASESREQAERKMTDIIRKCGLAP